MSRVKYAVLLLSLYYLIHFFYFYLSKENLELLLLLSVYFITVL